MLLINSDIVFHDYIKYRETSTSIMHLAQFFHFFFFYSQKPWSCPKFCCQITSQVTYVTMVPRVGNETLRPLGVATGNALSVTRSEDTYVKTPPVGRRQPMTSLPACHNISAAVRIHHQLLRLKLASEAWPEA